MQGGYIAQAETVKIADTSTVTVAEIGPSITFSLLLLALAVGASLPEFLSTLPWHWLKVWLTEMHSACLTATTYKSAMFRASGVVSRHCCRRM